MAATIPQVRYMNLLRKQVIESGKADPLEGIDLGAISVRAAGTLIDNLKEMTRSNAPVQVAEGYYRVGDSIAEVRISREGRPYGLLLDEETGRFDFTRGLIFRIASQGVKLTLDYAEEFGRRTHRCAICGRTEKDDPTLEFRFCSKCFGNYEYCQYHLYTHEHVRPPHEAGR